MTDDSVVGVGGTSKSASTKLSWRQRRAQRISKWDRPPEPKDWRFYVGNLGRILIASGLLMFGFVAYQLWGTGIETARAQADLEQEFEAAVDGDTTVADGSTTPVPSDESAATVPDAATASVPEVVPAEEQDIGPVVPGDALFKIEIPKLGVSNYVIAGVDREDLKKGPGHFPDSSIPGQLGKASIAGHRTTYGEPFRKIDQLENGDQIIITRRDGNKYTYAVTGQQVVDPEDYWVVTTDDPTVASLTLATCTFPTASQRLAVHAKLVPDESDAVGATKKYELLDSESDSTPATIPGDETTDGTVATTDESGTVGDGPSNEVQDAFVDGWFADDGAWSQIALWGAALSAVSILAYLLSRKTRHDSIGFAVGILPFLATLYFFYQNVNRLLPAGL